LAAGLRPDPLGELERSLDSLPAIGGLLLRRREGRGGERRNEKVKNGTGKG